MVVKKSQTKLQWNSLLFVSHTVNIWGRAHAWSVHPICKRPTTCRTGRLSSPSWPCLSPPRTPSTTRSWSRCCRAPPWPSGARRGPASPERSGPFGLARKGCGTFAAADAVLSPRWRRRWLQRRWRRCPRPSHPLWSRWFRTWPAPGCELCWRSSRRSWSTRTSGTGPFWLLTVLVSHSGRNTWRAGNGYNHTMIGKLLWRQNRVSVTCINVCKSSSWIPDNPAGWQLNSNGHSRYCHQKPNTTQHSSNIKRKSNGWTWVIRKA